MRHAEGRACGGPHHIARAFLDHVNFDTIACLMFMVDRALSSMRGEEIITGERPSDVSQGE
jgi:hypothetical protein